MYGYYLGLGSNQGDRRRILLDAVDALGRLGRVAAVSDLYETTPVGFADQPDFLNLVLRLESERAPRALLRRTASLEREAGRVPSFPNGPRPLDIDLLLAESGPGEPLEVDEEGLVLPHPRLRERAFVLVPLLEIAPGLREPGTGRAYADYLERVGAGGVERSADGGPGERKRTEESGG